MESKKVLITGAASGLGKAMALRWAQTGAQVVIVDIHDERGKAVQEELSSQGWDIQYFHCDICSDAEVDDLAKEIHQKWGRLDVLINNAGVATAGALMEEDITQWQWVLEINVLGAVRMTRAFLPLLKVKGGYILNVASQAGITAAPMMASYNASKAAIVSFSETLRLELIDADIGVSVLCPGFFKTNLDESVRSANPAMKSVVTKLLERGSVTAGNVADAAYRGVQSGQFMLLTHKEGIKAFRVKRLFPNYYLKMMAKQTRRLRQIGR